MNPEREHEALVQAWLKEPVWMPESDMPRIAEMVHGLPQRHGWLPPAVDRRVLSMLNATRFVAAGIIVALFGGFLVAGGLERQRVDGPLAVGASASATAEPDRTIASAAAEPDPPDWPLGALPEGATTGALDTPRGPAAWVRLPETAGPFPEPGRASVLPWPSGYASLVHSADDDRLELLVSEDGVRWHAEPLPLPPSARKAQLIHADGSYLLLGTGASASVWRSDDGTTWRQLDSDGVWPPGAVGLRWRSNVRPTPVTAGGRTLIGADFDGRLPRPRLDLDANCRDLTRVSRRVFECDSSIKRSKGPYEVRTLRFDVEEAGLQVLNHETGERLGTIPGADLATIERLADAEQNRIDELVTLLVEGDSIERVQPPWQGRDVRLASDGELFYAYEITEGAIETWTVWQSHDGSAWKDLGAPVLDGPLGEYGSYSPRHSQGRTTITFWSPDGPDSEEVASFDLAGGTSWTAAPEGNPEGTSRRRLDSGWFASSRGGYGPGGGDDLWVHVDGEWISLAPLGIASVREGCRAGIGAVGDLTFISADPECLADGGSGARWVLMLGASDDR